MKNSLIAISFFVTLFTDISAQNLGIKIHKEGAMMIHGGDKSIVGQNDPNNADVVRVLGDVEIGNLNDTVTATLGAQKKGELIIEGDLIRNSNGKASFDSSDVIFPVLASNQQILGGFESKDSNQFFNIISNKNSGVRLEMDSNVALKNNFIFQGNGYVRTGLASFDNGELYAAKLIIENSKNDALVGASNSSGDKNNIVEGQLEWNTKSDVEYTFPISIDPSEPLGGAQLVKVKPNVSSGGSILASFNRNIGGVFSAKDINCATLEAKEIINHGWWNLSNAKNDITNFNVSVLAFNPQNIQLGELFTLAKKGDNAPIPSYKLEGIDPNGCNGNSISGFISREGYTSFSDFAIAKLTTVSNNVLPNYISPNGDGKNDVWNIDVVKRIYPNLEVAIYNRWGNMVYRSNGVYNNDWRGNHYDGEDLPDGVYYYIIHLDKNTELTKTGFVQVMRH